MGARGAHRPHTTMTTHHTACILCSRNCGLSVEIEDKQFKKIRGDDDCPSSKGYICQKAARLTHYQTHADRLTHPLKRTHDGQFVRISWEQALSEIALKLKLVKKEHGGKSFAFYGGGGQGNHLGGAYNQQMLRVMGSRYRYNALAQEKTGDFWVNGRMFGSQKCHTTEDVEHADYLLIIGANPYQSHGIPNARDTLKHFKNDPTRTLVVVDPRKTETAKMADVHLQLKPGTDAYLMSAILSIIVREGLHDEAFVRTRCRGFDAIKAELLKVPVDEHIRIADVPSETVYEVARGYARAARGCLRIDLGIQQSLNSTLNSYLEKLLFLVTGNFGIQGGNNLHVALMPVISDSDERKPSTVRTVRHGMFPISGVYPPNLLADEIDHDHPERIRALFVDSGNPALTIADTARLEAAFKKLDLMVVVDVAMTETARHAHYVLPAASQYEKAEASGFNLEFPENYFHLRHPLFEPTGESLPEAEIYTRLLEHMGAVPQRFPILEFIARHEPKATGHAIFLAALTLKMLTKKELQKAPSSVLYRTLGKTMGALGSAAFMLPLSMFFAKDHANAVRRAGVLAPGWKLGAALYERIISSPQGAVISRHLMEDTWSLIANADKKVDLAPAELLALLRDLPAQQVDHTSERFPLVLMAGERRAYNANQIYRDPQWRKQDPHGVLRIHPDDAKKLGLASGDRAMCQSEAGQIEVHVAVDDLTRPGFVTLPHGYGMRYQDSTPIGPQLNRLTPVGRKDPLTHTPYHKYVPVNLTPIAAAA